MEINPTKFASKFKTSSSRLQNFDYSSSGIYFITICTLNKNNFFGKIINNQMELSKMGIIANQCLIDIPKHFSNITLDEYVVMPNHVHILFHVETPYMASLQKDSNNTLIGDNSRNMRQTNFNPVETHDRASLTKRYNNYFNFNQCRDVACNVSTNKQSNISKENKTSNYFSNISPKPNSIPTIIRSFKSSVTHQINPKTVFFAWQPRYHDHIIKDKPELIKIKNYIINNPVNWEKDKFYN